MSKKNTGKRELTQAEKALSWASVSSGTPMREDLTPDEQLPELDEIESPGGILDITLARIISEMDDLRLELTIYKQKVDYLTSLLTDQEWNEEDTDLGGVQTGSQVVVKKTQKKGKSFGLVVRNKTDTQPD